MLSIPRRIFHTARARLQDPLGFARLPAEDILGPGDLPSLTREHRLEGMGT